MAAVTSDNNSDLEDINPTMDLITFEDVPDHYHLREDLFLIYRLGRNFQPSSRDWIGLYRVGWSSSRDYLTYEWAQKKAINEAFPWLRSVLFQLRNVQILPAGKHRFQFLYVSKHDHIVGVSRNFLITDELPLPDHDLEYVERPLEGFEAFTCIETCETEGNCKADTLEIADSEASSRVASAVRGCPQKTCKDTFTLTCDADSSVPSLMDIWSDTLVNIWQDDRSTDKSSTEDLLSNSQPIKAVSEDHVTLASPFFSQEQNPFQIVSDNSPVSEEFDKAVVAYHQKMPIYSVAKQQACSMPLCVESTDAVYMHRKIGNPITYDVIPLQFDDMLKTLVSSINAVSEAKHGLTHSLASATDTETLSPVTQADTDSAQTIKKTCVQCAKKAQRLKALRIKRTKLLHKIADLRKSLADSKDLIEIKDLVLEDMAEQIKALTNENSSLQSAVRRPCEHRNKLQQMANRNRELLLEKVQALSKIQDLQSQQAVCDRSKAEAVQTLQRESDELFCQKAQLEEELSTLKEEHRDLQRHLDDIMFTLAKQGFRKMINTKGEDISLDTSKGDTINLEDWNMATCRKTERHLATIAAQEKTISFLKDDIESKSDQIQVCSDQQQQLKKQVEKSDAEMFLLKEKVDELHKMLDTSDKKVQSLSSLLMSEKKYRLNQIQRHQDRERQLQESVTSLQDALKSAKLIRQQQNHHHFNQDHNGNKIGTGPAPMEVQKTGIRVKHTQGGVACGGRVSKQTCNETSAPKRGFEAFKSPGPVVKHQPPWRSELHNDTAHTPESPCEEDPRPTAKNPCEKLNLDQFLGEDSDPEEDAVNSCGMFADIFTSAVASLSKPKPKPVTHKTETETVATLATLASKSASPHSTPPTVDPMSAGKTPRSCVNVASTEGPAAEISSESITPKKRVVSTKVPKGKKPRKFVFQYCNPNVMNNFTYTPWFLGGRPKSDKKHV